MAKLSLATSMLATSACFPSAKRSVKMARGVLDYVYNDPDYSTDHRNFKGRLDVGTADHEHVLAFVYKQMINESLGIWADITNLQGC